MVCCTEFWRNWIEDTKVSVARNVSHNICSHGHFSTSIGRPFPQLRTVITINIPTTRTAYTALLFSEVKYSDQTCVTIYANSV